MDFSPLIKQALIMAVYLLPVAILSILLKSAWFKGVMGEFIVNFSIKRFLNKRRYHLVKDVTLPTEDGTTQIDHIIVSIYGVFVIETKNYTGWIFGSENQRTWTQKLFKKSHKFQNPLHQNYKHVKTLQALLNLKANQLHSVVVFVGDSTFKTAMPDNVTQARGCIRYIKSVKEVVLSPIEVKHILKMIEAGRFERSMKVNRAHTKHVKSIVRAKND
jgi:hypothetical protein